MAESVQLLSLNVRGIGDGKKRREIFRWLKRYHGGEKSIVMLQETHSSDQYELIWEKEWGSKIFYSHGSSTARGVAILMPLHHNFDVTELWKDTQGRILALTLKSDDIHLNIANIYAPTKDKVNEQLNTLNELDLNLQLAESPFILGGDFNTCLNPILDKEGGKIEVKSKYTEKLQFMLDDYNIFDTWRTLNPNSKRFTWRQNHPIIQSRLDYFFASGELFYNIKDIKIKPSIKTDHSLLEIKLTFGNEQKRGPGFWKFNSALLRDEVYIDMIREWIEQYKVQYAELDNHGLKWDVIKTEIRRITIDYSKTQAKIRRMVENDLNDQYQEAAKVFEYNNSATNLEHLENIKEQIETINAMKTSGAHIRSKAQHIEQNEKGTAYFLNVEKRNYNMKHIKKLNITDTEVISNPKEILNEEQKFYEQLYTKSKNIDKKYYNTFLNNNIPKLKDTDKLICEKTISIDECAKALKSLKNGKSPGSDGFPPEFYKMFWKNINTLVYGSLLYAINNNILSIEQRRGVLKLILKKYKNPCFKKNWRPISLLNSDYKIFAQMFAIRLQEVLPEIISEYQNGYIKGRFIGYNIRTIIDIINNAEINKKDCLLIFLDFEKAFDQLEWEFIEKTLIAFNFGPFFINVVKTMYTQVTSCVTNNGYSSKFFEIQRGIRQGCPLSALLFILAAEILSIEIRHNKSIEGITINKQEIKLTQLADDTTLFLKNPESLQHTLKIIDNFTRCSGLKLNYTKTEALILGQLYQDEKLPIKTVKKACSLGIWYFDNMADIEKENHLLKLNDIELVLNKWKARSLTLLGKSTVIKTLAVPKINHLIANLSTPFWFVNRVQQIINTFLWNNKPPKIKNKVITNTAEMGGLKFPNIDILVKSQKIAWVKRIITNTNAAWMQLLYTFLPQMHIKHILNCSIDPNDLAEDLPAFYRQVLYAWYELATEPSSALDIRRQIIWFNKYLRINRDTFFKHQLYQRELCTINDLLTEDGKFLNYDSFNTKYNIHINVLEFFGIIDSIPTEWKKKNKSCTFPKRLINNTEDPHIRINHQDKNVTQVKSRDIYIKLLKLQETQPNCIEAWNSRLDLNLGIKDWAYIFTLPKETLCDTKTIEVQFKILHRCYATDSIIYKWDNTKSEYCQICKQKANIIHNFFMCTPIDLLETTRN